MKNFEIAIVTKGVEITIDISKLIKGDVIYFNATELAKYFGKKPVHYLRNEQTQEYLKALSESENLHLKNLVKTKRGGKYAGTWMHHEVALDFAMWLSPTFKVKLLKFIKIKLREAAQWRVERLEAKTGYKGLSEAVERAHNPAKFYHYANQADLLNRVMVGMKSKKYQEIYGCRPVDNMSAGELEILTKLQKYSEVLTDQGVACKDQYDTLVEHKERLQNLIPALEFVEKDEQWGGPVVTYMKDR